jgi:hypothetical protein
MGGNAYVGVVRSLMVIDISNPATPVIIDSVDTPGFAYDVSVMNGFAWVADGDSGGTPH